MPQTHIGCPKQWSGNNQHDRLNVARDLWVLMVGWRGIECDDVVFKCCWESTPHIPNMFRAWKTVTWPRRVLIERWVKMMVMACCDTCGHCVKSHSHTPMGFFLDATLHNTPFTHTHCRCITWHCEWKEDKQQPHNIWFDWRKGKKKRKGQKYLVPPRFELRSRDPESPILTLILWGLHTNSILFFSLLILLLLHASLTSFSFSSHWRHSVVHHLEQHVTATNRDSRLFPFWVFVYDSKSFHSNLKPLFSQMHLPLLEGRLLHSKTVNTWCHSQRAFNQQQGKALQSNYIIGIAFESFSIHSHSTSNKKHNNTLSVSLGNRHGMQLY